MSIFFDHHIIPERFRDYPAFRGIDKKTFDIDAPANRIYLPANRELAAKLEVSPHPSRHVGPYGDLICKRLKEIATIGSPAERLVEIKTLIDAMRVGFLNGHLYTNVPIGKTQEEVYQGVEKVLTDPKAYRDQYPDQLRTIRDVERRGADAGQDHLIKWLLYLDDPERQKLIDEAIARNPDVNITAGNRDLRGTNWSKFEALDPSSDPFRVPGSTSANPSDFPPLPGYSSPPRAGLNEQEGFARSDPRFTRALPPFPTLDPNERIGQLPPTTVAPSDPLVLQSDPHSGVTYPYYEDPLAGGASPERDVLPLLAGGAALGLAAPSILPWLFGIGGILAVTRTANAQESSSGGTMGAATPGGGVFSTGASPLNIIGNGLNVDSAASGRGSSASSTFGRQVGGASSIDPETRASTFADRFGSWAGTPDGTAPAEPANVDRLPDAPAGGSVAPENVRRLARVNESNAGSVFTSGSAPVPHLLPSTQFNERFGNWTVPTTGSAQPQPSKPIGLFADEPSYVIPPPIFGVDGPGNPHSDAEEWFSRWIRPLL